MFIVACVTVYGMSMPTMCHCVSMDADDKHWRSNTNSPMQRMSGREYMYIRLTNITRIRVYLEENVSLVRTE